MLLVVFLHYLFVSFSFYIFSASLIILSFLSIIDNLFILQRYNFFVMLLIFCVKNISTTDFGTVLKRSRRHRPTHTGACPLACGFVGPRLREHRPTLAGAWAHAYGSVAFVILSEAKDLCTSTWVFSDPSSLSSSG